MLKINKIISLIGLFSMSSMANIALAEHEGHDIDNDFFYSTAKVINIDPIIRNIQISTPHRECWDEEISRPVYTEHNNGEGNVLIGGIIGGVVGNQFGHGNGKHAATVVGSILGAAIGNDIAQQQRYTSREDVVDVEHHCRVTHTVSHEEQIEGYWVTYRFKGTNFKTRMSEKPGKRLKLRVQVTPVSDEY